MEKITNFTTDTFHQQFTVVSCAFSQFLVLCSSLKNKFKMQLFYNSPNILMFIRWNIKPIF